MIIVCAGIVNHLHTLLFSHQNIIYVVEIITHIDTLLETSNDHHKKDRKIIWCYLVCSQTFLILQLYFVFILLQNGTIIVSMYTFSVYINLGVTANELQYIALCQIIRSRFILINEKIKTLKNSTQNLGDKMEMLRYSHRILVQLTERTNGFFDIRLFFSFFCCMTNVLANLYFMIFGETYIFEPADQAEKIRFIILTFLWSLYYFMRMTMLCLASQTLCKEVVLLHTKCCW